MIDLRSWNLDDVKKLNVAQVEELVKNMEELLAVLKTHCNILKHGVFHDEHNR